MSVYVNTGGLGDMRRFFDAWPDVARQACALAINEVSDHQGLAAMRDDMMQQVNFPKGYLNRERFGVVQRANPHRLESVIRGRDRPTSLARFAAGQTIANSRKQGVRVTVKRGQETHMKRAFLVKLRNGNTGLAVRLSEGSTLKKSDGAVQLADNLYLLYGPSVDQVFKSVALTHTPKIAGMVSKEFLRQFSRLSRNV